MLGGSGHPWGRWGPCPRSEREQDMLRDGGAPRDSRRWQTRGSRQQRTGSGDERLWLLDAGARQGPKQVVKTTAARYLACGSSLQGRRRGVGLPGGARRPKRWRGREKDQARMFLPGGASSETRGESGGRGKERLRADGIEREGEEAAGGGTKRGSSIGLSGG